MEEPTIIKKQTCNYHVNTTYFDEKNQVQNVTINLTINFHSKTFDITPSNGGNNGFKFIQTSHQSKKWQAIASSIQKAITFANETLQAMKQKEDAKNNAGSVPEFKP